MDTRLTGDTLYAFVDLKDPFSPSPLEEEEQPGPILSLLSARQFDSLVLFHTPHTRTNAQQTRAEVARRHPNCRVQPFELPVGDPKDYSEVMGTLARLLRKLVQFPSAERNYVCVSSGTAEMRAAWFLLTAAGVLRATLLQLGSPAEPLFGAANVREVHLDKGGWESLRDLIIPMEYFRPASIRLHRFEAAEEPTSLLEASRVDADVIPAPPPAFPGLEQALQELGIFVGSAVLRESAERIAAAAEDDLPVLLSGETGTGKELFARLVHRLSARAHRPMVTVNCAAIPKDLVESHLFGHVKGAFTGAAADRRGKFDLADKSTLFLDEIGELPLDAQAKLLRVLQDGQVEPVGADRSHCVDARIVAATNRNLAAEIAAGRFREDLYYRLEVVQIPLPPLRERRSEIPMLAAAFLKRINQRRRSPRQLSKAALRRLEVHRWPGNVRELSNVIERSVLYSRRDVLGPEDLLIVDTAPDADPLALLPTPAPGFSLEEFLGRARTQLILRALEISGGNQNVAAGLLGCSKQAVNRFVRDQAGNLD